jgi:hypothetical protein
MRDNRFQIKEEQTLDLGSADLQKADRSLLPATEPHTYGKELFEAKPCQFFKKS